MELFDGMHCHDSESLVIAGMLHLLEHNTLAEITVAQLCRRAGVSRATYYRHSADKRDVVFSFYDQVMQAATADGSTQTQPELYLQRVFSAFHRNRTAMLRLYARGLTDILDQVMRCHFGRLVPSLMSAEDQYAISYRVGGVCACMRHWFDTGMQMSPVELAATAVQILEAGTARCYLKTEPHLPGAEPVGVPDRPAAGASHQKNRDAVAARGRRRVLPGPAAPLCCDSPGKVEDGRRAEGEGRLF